MASLVALSGPLRGETLTLTNAGFTVGRDPSNRLHPHDLSLSRRHCSITVDGDRVTVADLDSLNGTFVNGQPVKERRLEHGDQLKIGDSLFLFIARDGEAHPEAVVDFDSTAPPPTMRLRREDVRLLQPEKTREVAGAPPRATRELRSLLAVSRSLASITSTEQLQRILIDQLLEAIPADRAAIVIADDRGNEFRSVFARSRTPNTPVQISQTVVRSVIGDNVALLCNEPADTEMFRQAHSLAVSATRSLICAPLALDGQPRGALYVATSDPTLQFDDGQLQLVAAIAALASVALQNVERIEVLEREARELRAHVASTHNLIGDGDAMRHTCELIAKAARTDTTVLILGESGTGKELAARAIHVNSPRARRPFVAITAAVLSETLLESELFGHEKGAFTGALTQKKGQLELAEGGTVFLDEIGDLPAPLQVKLLRVLQEREFLRVGGTYPVKMDVRFIAATHRDLESAVKEGRFRQDLYYRLKVVTVRMPALRERRDDIPLLARFFLNKFSTKCKRRIGGFSGDALECLERYDWPGNVRELENAIERALVLGSSDRVLLEDLPESVLEQQQPLTERPGDYHEAVHRAKREIVSEALKAADGSYAEAARRLGLHPNNIRRLARSLGMK